MSWFFDRFADNRSSESVASRMRRRRFERFEALIGELPQPVRILDVGGTEHFWQSMGWGRQHDITLLNLRPVADPSPQFTHVQGDGVRLEDRFEEDAFDVVFSNSVIEHVGTWEAQRKMAAGIRTVGRSYFVQTPNKLFPIEPHFLVPGFQFLPKGLRIALVRRFSLGWYPRLPDRREARELVEEHRLLTRREMARLFPDAEIFRERFFGWTKSFMAVRSSGPRR